MTNGTSVLKLICVLTAMLSADYKIHCLQGKSYYLSDISNYYFNLVKQRVHDLIGVYTCIQYNMISESL